MEQKANVNISKSYSIVDIDEHQFQQTEGTIKRNECHKLNDNQFILAYCLFVFHLRFDKHFFFSFISSSAVSLLLFHRFRFMRLIIRKSRERKKIV